MVLGKFFWCFEAIGLTVSPNGRVDGFPKRLGGWVGCPKRPCPGLSGCADEERVPLASVLLGGCRLPNKTNALFSWACGGSIFCPVGKKGEGGRLKLSCEVTAGEALEEPAEIDN